MSRKTAKLILSLKIPEYARRNMNFSVNVEITSSRPKPFDVCTVFLTRVFEELLHGLKNRKVLHNTRKIYVIYENDTTALLPCERTLYIGRKENGNFRRGQ